jgi:hypothetical protein
MAHTTSSPTSRILYTGVPTIPDSGDANELNARRALAPAASTPFLLPPPSGWAAMRMRLLQLCPPWRPLCLMCDVYMYDFAALLTRDTAGVNWGGIAAVLMSGDGAFPQAQSALTIRRKCYDRITDIV